MFFAHFTNAHFRILQKLFGECFLHVSLTLIIAPMPLSGEEASNWSETALENNARDQGQNKNASPGLPMKLNKKFEPEECTTKDSDEDQKDVTAVAMCKLHEWFTCVENGTTTNCTPLRLTVCG
jgi:hypothetical protein